VGEADPEAIVLSGPDRRELVRRLLALRALGRDLTETFSASPGGGEGAEAGAAAVVESVDRMLALLRAGELPAD
jgi:hypothetical protein